MYNYGTLEYWMHVRAKENLILECLLNSIEVYKDDTMLMYTFCEVYKNHYEEYMNACKKVGELSECNADA